MRRDFQVHDTQRPVYTISVVAELVGVHPRTLRIYEEEGLIRPYRRGIRRLYSQEDVVRLKKICELLDERHLNLPGVRALSEVAHRFHLGFEQMIDELLEEVDRNS